MKKFDRSDLVAIIALLISFVSLWLGVYEARIMKEEQKLMQSQQKASVWPYLQKSIVYSFEEDMISVTVSLENKGVGPALIQGIEIRDEYTQQPLENNFQVITKFINTNAGDSTFLDRMGMSMTTSGEDVLSPGEVKQIFQLKGKRFLNDNERIFEIFRLGFSLCYASIYNDSWVIGFDKSTPEASSGCNN